MRISFCKDCLHFRQHYILTTEGLLGIFCGHCTFKTPRHKTPLNPACVNFSPSSDIRDLFPSKNYITKKLLDHLLSLDVLPEIKEDFSFPD